MIIFNPLGEAQIEAIVEIQAARLAKLLAGRGITLTLTKKARELLARTGYEPAFGARPLKRAIQRDLMNPLSVCVLKGEFKEGDAVTADATKDGITFRKDK